MCGLARWAAGCPEWHAENPYNSQSCSDLVPVRSYCCRLKHHSRLCFLPMRPLQGVWAQGCCPCQAGEWHFMASSVFTAEPLPSAREPVLSLWKMMGIPALLNHGALNAHLSEESINLTGVIRGMKGGSGMIFHIDVITQKRGEEKIYIFFFKHCSYR